MISWRMREYGSEIVLEDLESVSVMSKSVSKSIQRFYNIAYIFFRRKVMKYSRHSIIPLLGHTPFSRGARQSNEGSVEPGGVGLH